MQRRLLQDVHVLDYLRQERRAHDEQGELALVRREGWPDGARDTEHRRVDAVCHAHPVIRGDGVPGALQLGFDGVLDL